MLTFFVPAGTYFTRGLPPPKTPAAQSAGQLMLTFFVPPLGTYYTGALPQTPPLQPCYRTIHPARASLSLDSDLYPRGRHLSHYQSFTTSSLCKNAQATLRYCLGFSRVGATSAAQAEVGSCLRRMSPPTESYSGYSKTFASLF